MARNEGRGVSHDCDEYGMHACIRDVCIHTGCMSRIQGGPHEDRENHPELQIIDSREGTCCTKSVSCAASYIRIEQEVYSIQFVSIIKIR